MTDDFGRTISYLRLSVTDLCNLRCVYCMPQNGVKKLEHAEILSIEEIGEIVHACAGLGITKVRLTGGEPLVRRGIVDICRAVRAEPGIRELVVTTNGVLLGQYAKPLREAGVDRLNISLDTLEADKYRSIARCGTLGEALDGLQAAKDAGFTGTKINCVLIGGVNDDEIADFVALTKDDDYTVRFIELMPLGECAAWDKSRFISNQTVLKAVPALEQCGDDGVSHLFKVPGWRGRVGLISPVSNCFCQECNRIRVTADGRLKSCLHSAEEISLKGLHGAELERAVREGIQSKPQRHHLDSGSETPRNMNMIGG